MFAKLVFLTGLTVCLGWVHPTLADAVSDGIATIPGAVEDIRIAGTWQRDSRSGVYRIAITRDGGETVTARFFVQWVAYMDAGEAAVSDSMEIKEFAQLGLDVVDYFSESDAEGLTVFIETINPADGANEQYELFVFGPDEYRFGPATN